MTTKQLYRFDRGSAFYPIVTNFINLLWGFQQLMEGGIALSIQGMPKEERRKLKLDAAEFNRLVRMDVKRIFRPPKLTSRATGDRINISATASLLEVARNYEVLIPALQRSAIAGALIYAFESTKHFHTKSPLWEFLRHCRNAGAHGGQFHFYPKEPCRPARWQGISITKKLEGFELACTSKCDGLLSRGDVLRLLWDIEVANPSMVCVRKEKS